GVVFRALDRLSQQQVALKQVQVPSGQLRYTSYDPQEDANLALAQEFKILGSLRHPNVISVLDYGFDQGVYPYYVMDLLETPRSVYKAAFTLPAATRVNLLVQLLQALLYCHRRGVIHRDLKPENVLVDGDQVRVLDFGLSVITEKMADVGQGEIAGTPEYIAPEIYRGAPPSVASDLYAVGVIAWEVFVGRYLYDDPDRHRSVRRILREPVDLTPLTNPAIREVIGRLLEKDPAARYPDARATLEAFCAAIDQPLPPETFAIRESFIRAARLVGRDRELATFSQYLDEALEGKHRAILLGGESGVGKSRLLDELRVLALVRGVLVLRGEAINVGGAPYQPWRNVLRWLVLTSDLTLDEASILKPLIPDLSVLLNRDIPDAPEMNPLFAQERLLLVLEKLFAQQRQPMLLIMEDLHWAGSESLVLFQRLRHTFERLPLLIVGTFADDEKPDFPARLPQMTPMKLNRLDGSSIAELSQAMLGEAGAHPELVALLQRETEGNIFFLVEVMNALAEEAGQLEQIAHLTLPKNVLAGGVEQIIQRRLSRVPAEVLAVLQVAATQGRQIDLKVIQHTQGQSFDLARWLQTCANASILEVAEDTWRFAHNKLRLGVVNSIPQEHRPRLHAQVATALEIVYLHAPEHATALAYHWAMAGDDAREEQYSALAGKQSLQSGAYEEAARYLQRALALEVVDNSDTTKRRVGLLQQLGEAYVGLGDYAAARTQVEESLQIAQFINYRWGSAAALNSLGMVAYLEGNLTTAAAFFQEALALAMDIRAQKTALTAILGLASLQAAQAQIVPALELASLVAAHIASDQPTVARAQSLLAELRPRLPTSEADAAIERGRDLLLRNVVDQLLSR
ncbi:MAG: AAA family ATPase, partial [Anaerolineae bacterium]|nr:AAA family ATPase [Anaerolineae bacterium]